MKLNLFSLVDAVLVLAVPVGVGFCLSGLGSLKTRRPTVHLLILGVAFLANLFVLLEVLRVPLDGVQFAQRLVFLIGVLGVVTIAVNEAMSLRAASWAFFDSIVSRLLLPALLVGIALGAKVAAHQEYPTLNVYEVSHLIEGAVQFADRFVLNRFIADSYISIFQVSHGIVRSVTGGEVLGAWWLSGFLVALVAGLFVYRTAMRLTGSLFFSVSQAVFFPLVFGINNSSFSALVPLTLLSILFENQKSWVDSTTPEERRKRTGLLIIFALLVIFSVTLRSTLGRPFAIFSALMGILACLAWACFPRLSQKWSLPFWGEFVPILIIGVQLHRSHILESAIVLSMPIVLGCIRSWSPVKAIKWTAVAFVALAVAGIFGAVENKFVLALIGSLTGKVINVQGSLDMSGGLRNALFEWVRVFPLFTSAILGWAILSRFFSPRALPLGVEDAGVFIGIIVIGLSFFGVPFVYRTWFLVQFLFLLFFSKHFAQTGFDSLKEAWIRHRAILIVVFVLGLAAYWSLGVNQYLRSLLQYSAAAALSIPLVVWFFEFRLKREVIGRNPFFALALIALLFFEQRWMVIRFYDYSFGAWKQKSAEVIISHFSKEEMRSLLALPLEPKGLDVFFSDPVTLANLKSMRGAPSLYLFPNIADVSPVVRRDAIALMRDLFIRGSAQSDSIKVMEFVRRSAPVSTLVPVLERYPEAVLLQGTGESLRGPVGIPSDVVRVHILVNARTAKWMDCMGDPQCLGYFPDGYFESVLPAAQWPGASCTDEQCHQRLKTVLLSRRELIELACRCTVDDHTKNADMKEPQINAR